MTVTGNRVHDNVNSGISASSGALVSGNVSYGQATGIEADSNVRVVDNETFRNTYGIWVTNGSSASGNRSYANATYGIYTRSATVSDNAVYSNAVGIYDDNNSLVRNNVVYGNVQTGITVRSTHSGGDGVINNTVYQETGDAILVNNSANNVNIRNNVLAAASGYAINVAADSQVGFASDYNVVWLTGTARFGFWEDRPFASRLDWSLELGFDQESVTANPQFVDFNGADGTLGYGTAAVGAAIVLDEEAATYVGTWTAKSAASALNGDYRDVAGAGSGANLARWTFGGLADGTYQIAVTFPSNVSGNSSANYRVYLGAPTPSASVIAIGSANHSTAPNDFTADGRSWELVE